jgi:hypothetical protein
LSVLRGMESNVREAIILVQREPESVSEQDAVPQILALFVLRASRCNAPDDGDKKESMTTNKSIKGTFGNQRGATLVEATVAMAIAGVAVAGTVGAFLALVRSCEASSYSIASTALAIQGCEQVRAAKWDALSYPVEDEVQETNFPPVGLLLARGGTDSAVVLATNYTSITTVSTNPLLKLVKVDCVYGVPGRGLITNSVVSYRTAETGQQNAQQINPPAAPSSPPPTATTTATNSRVTVASAATNAANNSSGGGKVTYWSVRRSLGRGR